MHCHRNPSMRMKPAINSSSLALLLVLFAALPAAIAAGQKARANVIILISDDMGWNDVGYHGSKIRTPNIDRLAAEGMRLNRFYVHPICSPTRAAMMTGRSPARFGVTGPLGGDRGVPTDEHFMSQAFQAAGYQTWAIGKWHLGIADQYSARARGFDHFYGARDGVVDYYEHTFKGKRDWERNGEPIQEEGYTTDLFGAEAVRLIEQRDRSKPVFLYLAFNAPHGPVKAPDAVVRKYSQGSRDRRSVYYAAVDVLDTAIGNILSALDREGMKDNTLVMFFCDNGPRTTGDPGKGGLALRGGKGDLLEGGVRVPAVLRWPKVIPAGSKSEQMIAVMDLLPTLSDAVGIPHGSRKTFDGFNIWPAIRDNKMIPRNPLIVAGQRGEFAVWQDPLKLIVSSEGTQLYDVRIDPTESRNLAVARAADVTRLQSALEPLKTSAGSDRRGKVFNRQKGGKKQRKGDKNRRRPRPTR